jgi:hypothetical protein
LIQGAINTAISVFESTYSTNIVVRIYFQEGGGLGQSEFFNYNGPYQTYYNDLVAINANPTAVAGLTANGGNSVNNPVTGTSTIAIKSANARTVGIVINPGCKPVADTTVGDTTPMECDSVTHGSDPNSVDGIISLNTALTTPGSSGSSLAYYLQAVTEHEIDEILGMGSNLPNANASSGTITATAPAPLDLWRFDASGNRVFSVNCASPGSAFLSLNGTTDLVQFNNSCNGADFGDWKSGSTAQIQDAFGTPNLVSLPLYGSNETAALSAIGYTLAAPEPALSGLAACCFGWMLIRYRRRTAPGAAHGTKA